MGRARPRRDAAPLPRLRRCASGAIIAAPTTSLPEGIGGNRNYDYRYTWLRDAAFTVYAFLRLGFKAEAQAFMLWLSRRSHCDARGQSDTASPLGLLYTIDGKVDVKEELLDHLEGYRGSKPVRIGNAAHDQLQLDIYGELLDAVYLYNKHAAPLSYDSWNHLRDLIEWVVVNWRRADEGIWEPRGHQRQNTYSKLMCWVALDRALRLGDKRSFPMPRERWYQTRNEIYEDIMEHGWSVERQAFVQSYGSDALDASMLIMPLVFFMAGSDPRMLSTIAAIRKSPAAGGLALDGLVYRYLPAASPDGMTGAEGTFNMCSFWLVEALTRAGRSHPELLDQARLLFEKMLSYSNHLGLFSEQTGLQGEALGNFPQAFTHLALISAAHNLNEALGHGPSPQQS